MDKSLIYPEEADRVRQVLAEILDLIVPAVAATGLTATELEQIAADRFIKHVHANYGLRKRKTNVSRIALISGHSRKASKAISTSPAPTSFEFISPNQSAVYRALVAWRTERSYLDLNGRPMALDWEGDPSLSNLIRKVSADIPPGAVRYELLRNRYVDKREDGTFVITKRRRPDTAAAALKELDAVADAIVSMSSANKTDFI